MITWWFDRNNLVIIYLWKWYYINYIIQLWSPVTACNHTVTCFFDVMLQLDRIRPLSYITHTFPAVPGRYHDVFVCICRNHVLPPRYLLLSEFTLSDPSLSRKVSKKKNGTFHLILIVKMDLFGFMIMENV